jgi:hypothetical protein
MEAQREITVLVRGQLLANAPEAVNAGVSETVRKGLELLAANDAYERLLKMRGKAKFSVNLNKLRKDRRFN